MNRIDKKFAELRKKKKKALIIFVTAGYPNLSATEKLIYAIESSGADLIELGVPFSDPLADGPTIQQSSQQALRHHVNLSQILALVGRLRKKVSIPITLMTYYNPVFHYGERKFFADANKFGVDGVIIPDLPPEEAKALQAFARSQKIANVSFVSPTTTTARAKNIVKVSTGFIYYVSLTGVTGTRSKISPTLGNHLRSMKRLTSKPICVGFGVSTPQQARSIARVADGVIVGSAVIKTIREAHPRDRLDRVSRFVRSLSKALK